MLTPSKPVNFEHLVLARLDALSDLARSVEGLERLSKQSQTTLRLNDREPVTLQDDDLDDTFDDISITGIHRIKVGGIELILSGSTLLCRCPECSAPVTIQMWLGLADCWRCQTSIALTEEQLIVAQQIVEHPFTESAFVESDLAGQAWTPIPSEPDLNALFGKPAIHDSLIEEFEPVVQGSRVVRVLRGGFRMTPAWLVSLIFHLILILILALIVPRFRDAAIERIVLSTFLDREKSEGGKFRLNDPEFHLQDDLELASKMKSGDDEVRKALQTAKRDAEDLIKDLQPRAPLPDLAKAKENITNRPDQLMSFAARDPRVRAEIVQKEGGTTLTEAAVARALRWLASVQNKDGSWSLAKYDNHRDPKNKGDAMGTSLALLPMLGAGQTHEYGLYKEQVAAGLAWLIENQTADGDLRVGIREDAGMYAHGQATIVLCEALAMTGDERLRLPAQRAIQFIEEAQHPKGGWRYRPGEPGDTSVFGWQMMALQSARSPNTGLQINAKTLKLADDFLDSVIATAQNSRRSKTLTEGAAYAYMPGREATASMTAEALLCRMYLGWDRNDPRVVESVKWLVADHLPSPKDRQLYYWYYATQVIHHFGRQEWRTWNSRMREILVTTQNTKGRHPGSWETNLCPWGNSGGRIYTTSLACCILEVYYRHLPLFERIEF